MLQDAFLSAMEELLGDEYPSFIEALSHEAVKGIRVNRIKCPDGELPEACLIDAKAIPYCQNGYILTEDVRIGQTPAHHAGLIYSQDPGAMSALSSLDIEPDWWVLDTCAAPGGKTSQAAEQLSERGFILANEYVPKRAKIIVSNLERLGLKNAIVTSMDTEELARLLPEAFDLVITDAPCSGEGMFRKNDESQENWSIENVAACAKRQSAILENAYKTLAPGGYLLYSTCTYSLEENEAVVAAFLDKHEDMSLQPVKESLRAATAPGISIGGRDMSHARRFYPHLSEGEGQFVALMKRAGEQKKQQTFVYKDSARPLDKREREAVEAFFRESLTEAPGGRVVKVGNNITLISHGCPIPPHSVFMPGVLVGEVVGGILKPSHQFFSCYGKLFRLQIELEGKELEEYLRGAELASDLDGRGWCCICYLGAAVGGGKLSGGRIKNHYPKGLRNK